MDYNKIVYLQNKITNGEDLERNPYVTEYAKKIRVRICGLYRASIK